jgi:D-lactate dehydrogenase
MKIACVGVRAEERAYFERELPEAELFEEGLTAEVLTAIREVEVLSVFVDVDVSAEVMAALPALKLIATRSTGLDHIDTAEAERRGIKIANVLGYGKRSVAEFTFALLLTLSRKIFEAYQQVRVEGDYSFKHLRGFDLAGKTLGVVGTGQIGRHVIKLARAFEMEVLGFDAHPDVDLEAVLGFQYVDLDTLLTRSDVVTLHVPYLPETHHLLNKERLALVKPGAYIINTARGELIDTTALIEALRSGRVAGAGLDVLEGERELKEEVELVATGGKMKDIQAMLEGHILIDMPQVVVTPHIAFYSAESEREIVLVTIRNIKEYGAGLVA